VDLIETYQGITKTFTLGAFLWSRDNRTSGPIEARSVVFGKNRSSCFSSPRLSNDLSSLADALPRVGFSWKLGPATHPGSLPISAIHTFCPGSSIYSTRRKSSSALAAHDRSLMHFRASNNLWIRKLVW
jgi:hypothetical protein